MRKGQNKKRQKNGIFVVLLIMDLLSIYEVLYLLPQVHYFLHPKVYSLFSFLIPTEKWTWNLPPPQTHYFMNQASKAPSKGYIKLYLSVIVLMHFFFLFFKENGRNAQQWNNSQVIDKTNILCPKNWT